VAAGIDDALYTGKGNVGVVKGADGDQPGAGPGGAQLDQQIVGLPGILESGSTFRRSMELRHWIRRV
jgi:hypothetical protein